MIVFTETYVAPSHPEFLLASVSLISQVNYQRLKDSKSCDRFLSVKPCQGTIYM